MTDRTSLLGSSGPNPRTQCDPVEDMADVERESIIRVDIEHHLEEDSLADGRQEQPINEAQNRQSNFTGRSGGDLLRIRPRWGHAMAARAQSRYRPGSRNRRATEYDQRVIVRVVPTDELRPEFGPRRERPTYRKPVGGHHQRYDCTALGPSSDMVPLYTLCRFAANARQRRYRRSRGPPQIHQRQSPIR